MKKKIQVNTRAEIISYVLLFILAALPLGALFHSGIPITHDGPDHVARIANFYQSLAEGNLVPRWAGNLNWGYGHPVLMFLYPLPSYLASLFHAIGYSLVDSTKMVFGLSFIASVFAMYLWLKEETGTWPAFVGALFYGFAPYRFVDLYVRGAIGEHVAFFFAPIILYGVKQLSRNLRNWRLSFIVISLSVAFFVLSHNAISLMFFPIILLYILYLWYFETKKSSRFLLLVASSLGMGFLVSGFFWMPAFIEGKYTLRDIVTKGEYAARFVSWSAFFPSGLSLEGSGELSKDLGLLQWLGVAIALIRLHVVKEKKIRIFIFGGTLLLLLSLFIQTVQSSFIWDSITVLQKFQFPWRFLSVSVFLSATLGAIAYKHVISSYHGLFALCVIVAIVILTRPMWQVSGYLEKTDDYYTGTYNSTTDTGESSPIWSVRFMEKRFGSPLEVIEGISQITPIMRRSTKHEYDVIVSKDSKLVENTLYFPGWRVMIDGKQADVQFQDPQYRGLMTFWVSQGNHTVVVEFTDTKVRTLANIISVIGVSVLGILILSPVWKGTK